MRGTQPTQAAVVARGEGGLLRLRLAHLPLALLLERVVEGRALLEVVLGFFHALEELLALIRASRVGPEVDCAGTWKSRGRRRRRRRGGRRRRRWRRGRRRRTNLEDHGRGGGGRSRDTSQPPPRAADGVEPPTSVNRTVEHGGAAAVLEAAPPTGGR